MKYLKLFEEAKDFYIGPNKYIITTEDEKYVFYLYAGTEKLFVDIDILDELFHQPGFSGVTGKLSSFLIDSKESAERGIKNIEKYYNVYFVDIDGFKKLSGDYRANTKLFKRVSQLKDNLDETETEVVNQMKTWKNPNLKYKIIEYQTGAQKKSEPNL